MEGRDDMMNPSGGNSEIETCKSAASQEVEGGSVRKIRRLSDFLHLLRVIAALVFLPHPPTTSHLIDCTSPRR